MYEPLRINQGGLLPAEYDVAHDLCLVVHDTLVELIQTGEEQEVFSVALQFQDDADQLAFEQAQDVFEWLEQTRRLEDRKALLTTTVFPAVLSDMLLYIYEALEASRKGKLTVCFTLLRKPLQENLYLLEALIAGRNEFVKRLTDEPLKLDAKKQGGVDPHGRRIQTVLDELDMNDRFDAEYLAQLRYDKRAYDSFDGLCNMATHLFTGHPAIQTEQLNINFIFSQWPQKLTQWSYLYSRLPYIMIYAREVAEHIAAEMAQTDPTYLERIDRRNAALVKLWWNTVEPRYATAPLQRFAVDTASSLYAELRDAGCFPPTDEDLQAVAETGKLPPAAEDSQ